MASGLGGAGARSGSGERAAAGPGPAAVKTDAIDLEAISELVLAGHGTDDGLGGAGYRAHRLGDAPQPPVQTRTKQEPAARPAGPLFGLTMVLPGCWAPRSAVWSPRSSPTRTGSQHLGLAALSGSPPIVGSGFAVDGGPAGGRSPRRIAVPRGAGGTPGVADDLVLLACLGARSPPRKPRWPGCCRIPRSHR